ncbi:MAG: outer membrane beta-barrel domain-containing protein [Nannocystaceae bacterium]|nr:outer membrane beta-barrel domain-containing protein [bacterium]
MALVPLLSVTVPTSALASTSIYGTVAAASATTSANAAADEQPEGEEEEDLVIIDEGEEEEPPAEGEDPGGDAGVVDLDLGLDDDNTVDDGAAAEGSGEEALGTEEDQIKAEKGLITVVQRQRMLKKKRFELSPQFGITVNDPYVRHYTIGLDFNYWLTNRMALGVTGTGLIGAKTPRYDNIRFQEGLLLTANRTLWQGSVNFTYNPFYGKIAIFNRALLHWEGGLVVGGGATQTQVIPRYESLHEPFSTVTGGGHFGLVGRFYAPKIDWVSFNFGVRSWVYADKLEPINRGPDSDLIAMGVGDDPALDDPAEAKKASDFQVAFNVTFFLGVSFYLPTTFKYSTPR